MEELETPPTDETENNDRRWYQLENATDDVNDEYLLEPYELPAPSEGFLSARAKRAAARNARRWRVEENDVEYASSPTPGATEEEILFEYPTHHNPDDEGGASDSESRSEHNDEGEVSDNESRSEHDDDDEDEHVSDHEHRSDHHEHDKADHEDATQLENRSENRIALFNAGWTRGMGPALRKIETDFLVRAK